MLNSFVAEFDEVPIASVLTNVCVVVVDVLLWNDTYPMVVPTTKPIPTHKAAIQ